jgi:hypothetical protein
LREEASVKGLWKMRMASFSAASTEHSLCETKLRKAEEEQAERVPV